MWRLRYGEMFLKKVGGKFGILGKNAYLCSVKRESKALYSIFFYIINTSWLDTDVNRGSVFFCCVCAEVSGLMALREG